MEYGLFIALAGALIMFAAFIMLPFINTKWFMIIIVICIIMYIPGTLFGCEKMNNSIPEATMESVRELRNTDIQNRQNKLCYLNTDGEEAVIYVDEIKYDSDETYIEKQTWRWLFLYKKQNVLHMKGNE